MIKMPETSVPTNKKREIIMLASVVLDAIIGFVLGMVISPSVAVVIHLDSNNLSFSVIVAMLMATFFGSLEYYIESLRLKRD